MRDIEFRAWLKDEKKMVKVSSLHLDFEGIDYVDGVGNDHIKYLDEVELMQYTGRKDINKVKVFEGDIVKAYDHTGYIGTYQVKWCGDCYELRKGGIRTSFDYPTSLEVIGNIYENPELLKVKVC